MYILKLPNCYFLFLTITHSLCAWSKFICTNYKRLLIRGSLFQECEIKKPKQALWNKEKVVGAFKDSRVTCQLWQGTTVVEIIWGETQYHLSLIVKTHFTNKSRASSTYIYSGFHMEELPFSTAIITQLPKNYPMWWQNWGLIHDWVTPESQHL